MKQILAGFIMNGKAGGVDKYLLTFLESVRDEGVRIDFLTNEVDEELKTYLAQYQSELYPIDGLRHPVRQFRQVCEILSNKKYDAVYLNVSTAIDCIAAFAAKKMKVPERMIHSHSAGIDGESSLKRTIYGTLHQVCKRFLHLAGTRFYGCSKKAGEWLFPKKIVDSENFEVIYNAVDRRKFHYNEKIRKEVRRELGLMEDDYVLGHIGNFCYVKNYHFLIEVFEQVYTRNKNAVLILGGTGVEVREIQELVKQKKLEKAVHFLGWRGDADRLYQAMDIFLLPSRFEGMPIVGVEAQCSKLPCIFSNNITAEAKIQDHCEFLPITEGPEVWVNYILSHEQYDRNQVKLLQEADHYDLSSQKEQLRRIICH